MEAFKEEESWSTSLKRVVAAMLFVTLINQYLYAYSGYIAYRANIDIKIGLINLIYRKITKIKFNSLQKYKIGKVINLVANDLTQFDTQPRFISCFFAAIFALIAGSWLLFHFLGVACLPGIGYLLLVIPF